MPGRHDRWNRYGRKGLASTRILRVRPVLGSRCRQTQSNPPRDVELLEILPFVDRVDVVLAAA